MKKISTLFTTLLFIAVVAISNQANAQSSCAWAKKAGGTYDDGGNAIATDASGNTYAVGYYYSSTIAFGTTTLHNPFGNGPYMYIVKYDSCGNQQWAKQAGGNGGTNATSVACDAAGNIYVTGYFTADTLNFGAVKMANSSFHNVFLVKYNASGVAQWSIQGTGNEVNEAYGISIDPSNNIYLTGNFASSDIAFGSHYAYNYTDDGSTKDVFIAKFDNSGNNLWVKSSVSNSNTTGDVFASGIATDAAGNSYVVGQFESNYIRFGADSAANNGFYDMFIVKYDASGNLQWLRTAGDVDDDGASAVAADAGGNIYVTGHIGYNSTVSFGANTVTNGNSSLEAFVAKFDALGTNTWAKSTMGDYYSYNYASGISLDAAGNPYIIGTFSSDSLNIGAATIFNSGFTNGSGNYTYDVFVAKYKSNGVLSWARSAGGDSTDQGNGIATGLNGALYVTGSFNSPTLSFFGIQLTVTGTSGYNDAFIANNMATLPVTPQICLVSADSVGLAGTDQYNVVYWDKTPFPSASRFIVYREVTSGVYHAIGSRSYADLSQFTDTARHIGSTSGTGGDPNGSTYRYKIQIEDTSGTYSFMSPYHNTVYFVSNSNGTFTWNLYSVENATITPVTSFDLVRDDFNTGVWNVVQSTAGTQTTLNDPNYSTYQATANWRVDANGFNCNPTLRLNGNNGTLAAKVKSHSNQNNNRQVGIKQLTNSSQINIYPNPNKGNFMIETTATEKQTVQVFDVNGKLVYSQFINGNTSIDASNLADGVYNVSITGNGSVVNKRLVIVK